MIMNETKAIVMLKDEGFTNQEIAVLFDIHPLTVAKKHLRATTPKASRRPTPGRISADRARGMAIARIAARYDINKKAVKRYLAAAA